MSRLPAFMYIALALLVPAAGAYEEPAEGYLAARARLGPAEASSRASLQQIFASGDFEHVELIGDVCGRAFAAPTAQGEPRRTLMLTLDDGSNVALQGGPEIDELQVGSRIAVIASPSGAGAPGDLLLEAWAHEWDLPREHEPIEESPVEPAPPQPQTQPQTQTPTAPPGVAAAPPLPGPGAGVPRVDAVQTWKAWVQEFNPKLSDEQATNIVRWVLYYSQQYNVNHKLVFALIKWESWFDPGCVSHAGAIGLMQLMPGTARYLGVNPHNVQQNIEGGVHYLSEQLATYADRPNYERVILALACYNAGPNAVSRAGHRVPNITETRNYVRKVSTTFYELHQAGMP